MTTNRRWLRTYAAGGALLFLLAVSPHLASAQSLGDIARQDTERRAQATPGRMYTNADLVLLGAPAPSPVPAPVETPLETDATVPGTTASGEAAEPDDELDADAIIVEAPDRYQEQRRARLRDFQERLAKAEAGIAAAEARLSRLDAEPETPTTVREQEVITATLRRLQRDANALRDTLAPLVANAEGEPIPAE